MDYKEVFTFIIESSLLASLLLPIILIIRGIIKNKVSPTLLFYIWGVFILKLIFPYGPESNISIYSIVNSINYNVNKDINRDYNDNLNKKNSFNESLNINNNQEYLTTNNLILSDKTTIKGSVEDTLFFVWIIGLIILFSYNIVIYIRFITSLKYENNAIDEKSKYIFIDCLKDINIKRDIKVFETSLINTPSIYGVFKPKILIPSNLKNKLSEKELRYVFMHELSHLKRGDILVTWIIFVIKLVHWFNPLMNIALNKMKSDCELACDYSVLSYLDKNENIIYGNTIITIIDNINNNKYLLGSAAIVSRKNEIKGRIKMISNNKRFGKKSLIMGLGMLLAISVIGLTSCNTLEQSKIVSEEKTDSDDGYSLEEIEKDSRKASDFIEEYINKNGYKVVMNSGLSHAIKLPSTFNETINDINVGKLIEEGNELSKKNGYDFSKYLGQKVNLRGIELENDKGIIVVLTKDEQVIGFWIDNSEGYEMKPSEICSNIGID